MLHGLTEGGGMNNNGTLFLLSLVLEPSAFGLLCIGVIGVQMVFRRKNTA